jgi:hypothetical protein
MPSRDPSNEPEERAVVQSELPQALRTLLNEPTYVSGANTSFVITDYGMPFVAGNSIRTRGTAATEVADIRSIAEGLMFDSTRLVSIIEAQNPAPIAQTTERLIGDTVSVVSVLRGGSALTAGFVIVCTAGSALSGSTLIHPLLGAILLVASLGFYCMSFLPAGKKYG